MFTPKSYENARPDGFGVMEIVESDSQETERLFVALKRTELTGHIVGPLAELTLVQIFGYSQVQCDRTLEALYRFPLPGDAAVMGVTVRFGEVEIRAELKERQQAEADYAAAKQQGQQATLATREAPDVFTLQIAGLQPDQEIQVETHYVQLARAEGIKWTLRSPLTTAPRYVREDEVKSRHAQGQPLALLRDPGHRFALDLHVQAAEVVLSPTHALRVTPEKDSLRVTLQEGEVVPDRDCVLQWIPRQEAQNPSLFVLFHDDPASSHIYFFAQVTPPRSGSRQTIPREVVLLVDHSGSMRGAKWEASDWAVKQFLNGLTPQDAFALGLFHFTTKWFMPRLAMAEAGTVAAANQFLETNRDSGGTNLGVALEQAIHMAPASGDHARHILIMTDAEVSDAGRILRLAAEASAQKERRRISVVCIDSAPNATLAVELAERGGGVARFLTSAPSEGDITTALETLLEDWSAPVYTDLRLEINRTGVEATGRKTQNASTPGVSQIELGDLPGGRAIWVAGRVERSDSLDLAFQVKTSSGQVLAASRWDLASPGASCPGIKALFGARRVQRLEYLTHADYEDTELAEQLKALGYTRKEILQGRKIARVYAENTQETTSRALRGLLVQETLEYGLASAETAFVAVRTEAGKPIEGTVVVANALPQEWSETFLGRGAPGSMAGMRARHTMAAPASAPRMMSYDLGDSHDMGQSAPVSIDYLAAYEQAATPAPDPQQASGMSGMFSRLFAGKPKRRGASHSNPLPEDSTSAKVSPLAMLFEGIPSIANGEATLFDSRGAENANRLFPEQWTRLEVQFPSGAPDPAQLGSELMLLLYVDDLAVPSVRVRLADMVRQAGVRPLNIRWSKGQVIRAL